jgi:uncharacterized protein (TIGR00730 family)
MKPKPAFLNAEFLDSDAGRPLRILSEYLEPRDRFEREQIHDTVVFFGSARVLDRRTARRAVARATSAVEAGETPARVERLRRARKALAWSRYYEDARELARLLTEWTLSLDQPRWRFVVCSGGGPGIMEAANRGASEAGGSTIGLNIELPHEQAPNRYVTERLGFEFHYFFMRKFWFAYLAKALVIFPGGFGTLDELFEMLTLVQTHRVGERLGVLLYGRKYWDRVLGFGPLADWGAINPADLRLMARAETPQEAFAFLRDHLTTYHLEMPQRARDRARRSRRRTQAGTR